jgi:hypothetical protein
LGIFTEPFEDFGADLGDLPPLDDPLLLLGAAIAILLVDI